MSPTFSSQDSIPAITTTQHPSGVANDILLAIFCHFSSSGDLFRCALVHRQWTPLANSCLYRNVALEGREKVVDFYACLVLRSCSNRDHLQRGRLVRTLHVELLDRGSDFRTVNKNMEAYRKLGDILGHLTGLARLYLEVFIGQKTHEYSWMQNLSMCFPESLNVLMINVSCV